jgi:beta-lactamase regulating signal transducer with metallopeptidase domain
MIMETVLLLAAKSLLIAGATLLLLRLMQRRSSTDRSWIAHLGLVALLLVPIGSFAVPGLEVARPAFLVTGAADAATPTSQGEAPFVLKTSAPASSVEAIPPATATSLPETIAPTPVDWLFWGYAAPAVLLLLLTAVALLRLVKLKARANVLVDTHWLQALAQAQRRMGFKNGTALLTSDDLRSPISWGLMRPVILLNEEAAKAHDEAEAIIAHELAHIARLDWAKLMLARVATALFWFNPLVWLLAREAHQLREEAADDAVLRADVEDTQYAQLLVGIARHESRGLLLGAHGVAPGKGSLARRVKRVLDGALERAPGGWRWGSAAAFVALGMSIPVAAMQFVSPQAGAGTAGAAASGAPVGTVETAVRNAVPAAVSGAVAAALQGNDPVSHDGDYDPDSEMDVDIGPNGHVGPVGPIGPQGRVGPDFRLAKIDKDRRPKTALDRAIELKAVGATPGYVVAIRRAAPQVHFEHDRIVEFAALGVSPAYVKELASNGYANLSGDEITAARALGINGDYIREIRAVGYGRLTLDQLIELKAVGITPSDMARYRRATGGRADLEKLIEMKAVGLSPEELEAADRE